MSAVTGTSTARANARDRLDHFLGRYHSAVRISQRRRDTGAGRRNRRESFRLKDAGAHRVPGVGQDENRRGPMKAGGVVRLCRPFARPWWSVYDRREAVMSRVDRAFRVWPALTSARESAIGNPLTSALTGASSLTTGPGWHMRSSFEHVYPLLTGSTDRPADPAADVRAVAGGRSRRVRARLRVRTAAWSARSCSPRAAE